MGNVKAYSIEALKTPAGRKKASDELLESIVNNLDDRKLAEYILTMSCKTIEEKETDIIMLLDECVVTMRVFKEHSSVTATRLFKILEIIIDKIKEIADDGGLIEIISSGDEHE